MKYLKGFIVATTFFLLIFLSVGFVLSGEWRAERTVSIAAPAEVVWPMIADLRRWDDWAPLGEVEGIFPGATTGPGAVREWDDPAWGYGSVTIRELQEGRRLAYDVRVEGGLQTAGTLLLEASGAAETRVTWREEGDFGWNPLLSWFAWGMEARQGAQLERGLQQLRALAEGA
jgi:hypothetical protein